MSVITSGLLALSMITAAFVSEATSPPQVDDKRSPAPKMLTLSGCVSVKPGKAGGVTLLDAEPGTMYQLVGLDMRKYAGRRVRVSGVASRRVRIMGGLYPSPNVAAQAGAIDPARAAVAASSASAGAAGKPLPAFRVKSIQTVSGACAPR